MGQIHALSNERFRLYGEKWTRRNRDDYRNKIKSLDEQIAALWHEHRRELASPKHQVMLRLQANVDSTAIAEDYFEHVGIQRANTGHQIKDGDKWRSVDTDDLAQAVGRYVADIPADDPQDTDIPPLKDILKRRGLTLRWYKNNGYTYGRLATLSS